MNLGSNGWMTLQRVLRQGLFPGRDRAGTANHLYDRDVQLSRMSGLGQKQKSSVNLGMSVVGGEADFNFGRLHVCL